MNPTNRTPWRPFSISLPLLLWLSLAGSAAYAADPGKTLVEAVQPFVEGHTLAGAVMLVADKEKTLALEAAGWADVAAQRPMPTDAVFWIASQSKPMTATAFMILVDEGRVSLDEPVERYLPEFQGQMVQVEKDAEHVLLRKPAHPIKVREILSHTSGLPFSTPMEQPTLDALPLKDAVRSYAMSALLFQPGTKYQYSNAGINTAGRIIEVISGQPYERFLEERLLKPLGMNETTFWPGETLVQRVAKSYKPNAEKAGLEETVVTQLRYPLSERAGRYPMPAGGLFSTASDTARFCRMILNRGELEGRRVLSEAAVKQLTSRQTAPGISDSYGLGFAVGPDWCGHGGAYATNMRIDRAHGLVLVWMVQHAGYPGNGGSSQDAFNRAALAAFGGKH